MTFSERAVEAAVKANLHPSAEPSEVEMSRMRRSLSAALAVDGLALVPKEPTEAMLRAGFLANVFTNKSPCGPLCVARVTMPADKVWTAMLTAASDGEVG